jgi:hypothetical protein
MNSKQNIYPVAEFNDLNPYSVLMNKSIQQGNHHGFTLLRDTIFTSVQQQKEGWIGAQIYRL